MKPRAGIVALAAIAALTACGGSPTQPAQPALEGCTITAASPVAGSQLKAGVPVTLTVTGRCNMNEAPSATVIMGGIYLPSQSATATVTRPISRGTTTLSLQLTFTPPASEMNVSILMGIVYDDPSTPPNTRGESIFYTIG